MTYTTLRVIIVFVMYTLQWAGHRGATAAGRLLRWLPRMRCTGDSWGLCCSCARTRDCCHQVRLFTVLLIVAPTICYWWQMI